MEFLVILDERNVVRALSGASELLGISPETEIVGRTLDSLVPDEMGWFDTLWDGATGAEEAITTQVTTVGGSAPRTLDVAAFWLPSSERAGWRVVALRDPNELRDTERRLEWVEARFHGWMEQAPAVVYSSAINSPGSSLYVSPHVETLLGYSTAEWRSGPTLWLDRLHPDDRQRVLKKSSETRATGQPFSVEYRLIARDGRIIWVSDDAIIVRDEENQPLVWQGMLFDITARKQAEQWLEGQKRVLEQIAQGAPLASILELIAQVIEPQIGGVRCALFLVDGAHATLQLAAAPSLPERFARAIDGEPIAPEASTAGAAAFLRRAVITADIAHDKRWAPVRTAAHSAGIAACWAVPILSSASHSMGVLAIYADMARAPSEAEELLIEATVQLARIAIERQEMVDHLIRQAFTDSLTGLPNRALLQDRLIQALVRTRRREGVVAVIFLDLDRFKVVNDRYGHHAGDQLLKLVAERLRGCVRAEDTVARFGGDEFVILLEDGLDEGEVREVAQRVLSRFETPLELGDESVRVVPSIGIAVDGTGTREPSDLLREADRAMYEAKRRGNGGYVIAAASQPERSGNGNRSERFSRRAAEDAEFFTY
jgi:diguanylate cyclase (GGDEF)-like protein/PAS domain S-box-containing protein